MLVKEKGALPARPSHLSEADGFNHASSQSPPPAASAPAMHWCKLWHDAPFDPKLRIIARRSGQRLTDVISVFICLKVNASANAEERGTLRNFDAEEIAVALDLDEEAVTAIFAAMQGKILDGDRLVDWEKRQEVPKRDSSAPRMRRMRQRQQEGLENKESDGCDASHPSRDASRDGLGDAEEKRGRREESSCGAPGGAPSKPISRSALLAELETVLDPERADAVVQHRNRIRKPLTERAAKLLAGKFARCRDPGAAADAMISNGWQGFEPEWMENLHDRRGSSRGASAGIVGVVRELLVEAQDADDRDAGAHPRRGCGTGGRAIGAR